MPRRRIKRLELPRHRILTVPDAEFDAFIAQGLAAGLSVPELMAQVLPSVAQEQEWKAERIRADNERKTAKRLARIAAQNDPAKLELARAKFQKRMRETARRKTARLQRLETEAQEKVKALARQPDAALAPSSPERLGGKESCKIIPTLS